MTWNKNLTSAFKYIKMGPRLKKYIMKIKWMKCILKKTRIKLKRVSLVSHHEPVGGALCTAPGTAYSELTVRLVEKETVGVLLCLSFCRRR